MLIDTQVRVGAIHQRRDGIELRTGVIEIDLVPASDPAHHAGIGGQTGPPCADCQLDLNRI